VFFTQDLAFDMNRDSVQDEENVRIALTGTTDVNGFGLYAIEAADLAP